MAPLLDNPKFPLKALFENKMFPDVEALVGPGGKFEGYVPIFQGDNAGPHAETEFVEHVEGYCRDKGWRWEPQAPQMPHMNVLDLSVFPCMSKRHTMLSRDREGLKVLTEDQTWDAAEEVWMGLENWKIASACIQAHRIAKKVIVAKGNNDFLGNGDDRSYIPHQWAAAVIHFDEVQRSVGFILKMYHYNIEAR